MQRTKLRITGLWVVLIVLAAQSGHAQGKIDLNYSEVIIREDFREPNDNWPNLSTMENLYMVDKDEYFMHRRNSTAPYALMLKWENVYPVYQILASLRLGPMEREEQTIGVILQVQVDGKGAFVMEVNRFKQVRVKQLVGSYYRYITGTGTGEDKGWVKGNVRGREETNEFDIRVNGPQVDFYINKKFVISADAPEYKPGTVGLLIGPDTKAKADYFYVLTTGDGRGAGAANEEEKKQKLTAQEELVKVKFELEQMKKTLASKEIELKVTSERMQQDIERITKDNEELMTRVRQLQEFKNQLDVDIDGDVFLTLAGNLRDELKKNAIMEEELELYKDSLRINNEKFRKFKLTMLDGAITKAERDKKNREAEEAAKMTGLINAELKEKKWKEEQEKYEAERRKEIAKKIDEARNKGKATEGKVAQPNLPTDVAAPSVAEKAEAEPVKGEPKTEAKEKPTASEQARPSVAQEAAPAPKPQTGDPGKAAPLPVMTRKATKAKD
jgi:hypothetical protein